MFLASIKHGLANLANFSGRDRQGTFWCYAGAVVAVTFGGWFIYFATVMAGMFARMQAFAKAHPDQVTVEQGPGHYSMQIHGSHPELMPDFKAFLAIVALLALVIILLIAAAAARRLHDSNVTGWVGLVPVVFLCSGLWLMGDLFGAIQAGQEPDLSRFFLTFGNNMIYIFSLVGLAYLLARKGTPGDNRYGPPPG